MKRASHRRSQWTLTALTSALVVFGLHAPTLRTLDTQVLAHSTGDFLTYHFCIQWWVRETLLGGHLPLWNPLIFCGFPQWAEGQLSLVGPLGPLLVLPLTTALNLWWVSLSLLTTLTALAWMASLHMAPLAALLGALSVTLSSAVIFRIAGGHPNIVACFPWLFLLAAAWNWWWGGWGRHWLLIAGTAFSLLLWAGHIQTAYELMLWWGLVSLIGQGLQGRRGLLRWGRGVLVLAVIGLAGAAAQVLPQIEFARLTPRQEFGVFDASTYSFPVENLLTLVFPGCFGHGLTTPLHGHESPYTGRWFFFWEASLLLNPLILGCLFLPRARRHRRMSRGLWVASVLSALLALGRQTPLFVIALEALPGFGLFRGHGRQMTPALFGLVAFGCLRFDQWLRSGRPGMCGASLRPRQWALVGAVGLCGLGLGLALWADHSPASPPAQAARWLAHLPLIGNQLERFPPAPADMGPTCEEPPEGLSRSAVFLGAFVLALWSWLVLLMLALAASRARVGRPVFLGILVAASLGITLWRCVPYLTRVEAGLLAFPPESVEALRATAGSGRALLLGRGIRNLTIRHGIPSAAGYAALLGQRQNTLLQMAFNHPAESLENDTYAGDSGLGPQSVWLGVHALMTTDPEVYLRAPYTLTHHGKRMLVWRAPDPTPLAWVATGGIAVASSGEAIERLRRGAPEDRGQVFLETDTVVAPAAPAITPLDPKRPSPGEITLDLTGAPAGWVVVLESLLPGWRAWIDGEPAPIIPAQVAFQAVRLPSGGRELRLAYRPASFRLGLFASLGTAAAVVTAVASSRRRPSLTG